MVCILRTGEGMQPGHIRTALYSVYSQMVEMVREELKDCQTSERTPFEVIGHVTSILGWCALSVTGSTGLGSGEGIWRQGCWLCPLFFWFLLFFPLYLPPYNIL